MEEVLHSPTALHCENNEVSCIVTRIWKSRFRFGNFVSHKHSDLSWIFFYSNCSKCCDLEFYFFFFSKLDWWCIQIGLLCTRWPDRLGITTNRRKSLQVHRISNFESLMCEAPRSCSDLYNFIFSRGCSLEIPHSSSYQYIFKRFFTKSQTRWSVHIRNIF